MFLNLSGWWSVRGRRRACAIASAFAVALLLVSVPGLAQAQAVVTGVTDDTGGVLPGAAVAVETAAGDLFTVSDGTGRYTVEEVPLGLATVVVRLVNFSTGRVDFTATAGEPVTVDVQLSLAVTADVVATGSRTFRNIADLDNPRENLVGVASSASVGAVTAAQLEARPIMRPGEVLESVPGFIVSQHSGEGRHQYYLRGFNLDHGSDFATTLAGVPLNESGAHAHGYTDVNQLIPELVSGAGSANISYVNRLDRSLFSLCTGGQDWGRVQGAVSPWSIRLLNDGPSGDAENPCGRDGVEVVESRMNCIVVEASEASGRCSECARRLASGRGRWRSSGATGSRPR